MLLFYSQIPQNEPRFDLLVNDEWSKRHMVVQKFVQAGRKVICNHQCTLYLYNWLACFRRLVSKTKRVSEQHYNSGGVETRDPLAFSLHSSAIVAPFAFRSVVVTEHLQQASNRWTLRKHLFIIMRCWRSIVIEPFGIPLKPCIFSGLFSSRYFKWSVTGKEFSSLRSSFELS